MSWPYFISFEKVAINVLIMPGSYLVLGLAAAFDLAVFSLTLFHSFYFYKRDSQGGSISGLLRVFVRDGECCASNLSLQIRTYFCTRDTILYVRFRICMGDIPCMVNVLHTTAHLRASISDIWLHIRILTRRPIVFSVPTRRISSSMPLYHCELNCPSKRLIYVLINYWQTFCRTHVAHMLQLEGRGEQDVVGEVKSKHLYALGGI